MKFVFALLSSLCVQAQVVTVAVEFKLTDLEWHGLPGVPVRLVLGEAPDWQDPNAGHRFVTDKKGQANFTAKTMVDRRTRIVAYAQTGLSIPKRVDHIMIAAELEQLVPAGTSGQYDHFQWLHTFDIDCYSASDCASSGITAVYTRDGHGRFSRRGQSVTQFPGSPPGLKMPELGEIVLSGPGYKTGDFFLAVEGADPARKRWTLRITLQRSPMPVRR